MALLIPKDKKEIEIVISERLLNVLIAHNVILLGLHKQDLHVICCIHGIALPCIYSPTALFL